MRVIFLPDSDEGWLLLLLVLAIVIGIAVAIAVWQRLWPSVTTRVLADERYRQAHAVYVDNLQMEEPTPDERQAAFTEAVTYLIREYAVPSAEAAAGVHAMVAACDRERSYELRNDAAAFEQDGDYVSALAYYERAAKLQQEHDPKDYQVLQRCIARVRRKGGFG